MTLKFKFSCADALELHRNSDGDYVCVCDSTYRHARSMRAHTARHWCRRPEECIAFDMANGTLSASSDPPPAPPEFEQAHPAAVTSDVPQVTSPIPEPSLAPAVTSEAPQSASPGPGPPVAPTVPSEAPQAEPPVSEPSDVPQAPTAPPSLPPGIVTPDGLAKYGLGIHEPLRSFVCTRCFHLHLPEGAGTHARACHRREYKHIFPEVVAAAVKKHQLCTTAEQIIALLPPRPRGRIPGLPVKDGWACRQPLGNGTLCQYVCLKERSMSTHCSDEHRGQNAYQKKVAVQLHDLWVSSKHALLVPLDVAPAPSIGDDSNDFITAFFKHLPPSDPAEFAAALARRIPPHLRKLKWQSVRGDIPFKVIETFIQNPGRDDPRNRLKDIAIEYVTHVHSTVENMGSSVATMVNTPDGRTAGPHLSVPEAATATRYARNAARLVTWLLRVRNLPPDHLGGLKLSITPEQHRAADALDELLNFGVHKPAVLRRAFHDAFRSLLAYHYAANASAASDPLNAFLVFTQATKSGGFQPARLATPFIAGLKHVVALNAAHEVDLQVEAAIRKYYERHPNEPKSGPMQDASDPDYNSRADALARVVSFLGEGRDGPCEHLYRSQRVLSSAALNEVVPGVLTRCTTDGLDFIYDTHRTSVADMRTLVCDAVSSCSRLLDPLLLGAPREQLPIPATVQDHLTNETPAYSPWTSRNNVGPEPLRVLMDWYSGLDPSHSVYGTLHHGVVDGVIQWNYPGILRYLRSCADFLSILMVAIHVSCGQPSRGTELAEVLVQNLDAHPCGVRAVGDDVVIALYRHKTDNITGSRKLVLHYLPRVLRETLIAYLCFVRPLEHFFVKMIADKDVARIHASYLFTTFSGPLTTVHLTQGLELLTLLHMGKAFGTQAWRQIAAWVCVQWILKKYPGADGQAVSDSQRALEVSARLAGHSVETVAAHYGVEASDWAGIKQGDVVEFKKISTDWHKEMHLSGDPARDIDTLTFAVQAHTPSPSAAVPMDVNDIGRAIAFSIQGPLREYIRDAIAEAPLEAPPKSASGRDHPSGDHRVSNTRVPIKPGVESLFQEVTNHPAWSSIAQGELTQAILDRKLHVLGVLQCGRGKTITYCLGPLTTEKGMTTIVVIPFVALMDNALQEAQRMGLFFAVAGDGTFEYQSFPSVLYVPLETLGTPAFTAFVERLRGLGRLARIVFDEAHVALTSPYRAQAVALYKTLAITGVPSVLLTATMPIQSLPALMDAFNLTKLLEIRESCLRKQIRYEVKRLEIVHRLGGHVEDGPLLALLEDVREARARLGPGKRIIVFGSSVERVETVAANLRVEPFVGSIPREEKTALLTDFQVDDPEAAKVIVATSALSNGVDLKGVGLVCYLGIPHGVVELVQCEGRIRGKEPVNFIIYLATDAQPRKVILPDHAGVAAMNRIVEDPRLCIRLAISQFLDATARTCFDVRRAMLCKPCEDRDVQEYHVQWPDRRAPAAFDEKPLSFEGVITSTAFNAPDAAVGAPVPTPGTQRGNTSYAANATNAPANVTHASGPAAFAANNSYEGKGKARMLVPDSDPMALPQSDPVAAQAPRLSYEAPRSSYERLSLPMDNPIASTSRLPMDNPIASTSRLPMDNYVSTFPLGSFPSSSSSALESPTDRATSQAKRPMIGEDDERPVKRVKYEAHTHGATSQAKRRMIDEDDERDVKRIKYEHHGFPTPTQAWPPRSGASIVPSVGVQVRRNAHQLLVSTQQQAADGHAVAQTLRAMSVACSLCSPSQGVIARHERFFKCPMAKEFTQFRPTVALGNGICWRCFAPLSLPLIHYETGVRTECEIRDALKPLAYGIFVSPRLRQAAIDELGAPANVDILGWVQWWHSVDEEGQPRISRLIMFWWGRSQLLHHL